MSPGCSTLFPEHQAISVKNLTTVASMPEFAGLAVRNQLTNVASSPVKDPADCHKSNGFTAGIVQPVGQLVGYPRCGSPEIDLYFRDWRENGLIAFVFRTPCMAPETGGLLVIRFETCVSFVLFRGRHSTPAASDRLAGDGQGAPLACGSSWMRRPGTSGGNARLERLPGAS
jgi:hypothetical protein